MVSCFFWLTVYISSNSPYSDYDLMGVAYIPLQCHFPRGAPDPHLIFFGSLGPTSPHPILTGPAIFARLIIMIDRETTDRPQNIKTSAAIGCMYAVHVMLDTRFGEFLSVLVGRWNVEADCRHQRLNSGAVTHTPARPPTVVQQHALLALHQAHLCT